MEDTEVTKKIYNYVIQRDENFGYNRMIATNPENSKWLRSRYMVRSKDQPLKTNQS